jgi:hypothetical protein
MARIRRFTRLTQGFLKTTGAALALCYFGTSTQPETLALLIRDR